MTSNVEPFQTFVRHFHFEVINFLSSNQRHLPSESRSVLTSPELIPKSQIDEFYFDVQWPLREQLSLPKTKEKKMKRYSRMTLGCILVAAVGSVFAWDGVAQGKIQTLEITDSANYGFRVALNPMVTMCSGGPGYAYLLETDSNYKVYVAALLTAKAAGNNVSIFSRSQNGNCHIGHVVISP